MNKENEQMGKVKEEVAKKEENALTTGEMSVFGNAGFEGTTAESFMIPMLLVVNALSDVKKKSNPSYNAAAEDGQFYNPALDELYDEVNLRVLSIDHQIVTWKPKREGFVASHHKTEEKDVVTKVDGLQKWDKDGNDVIDTIMLTCMDVDNPSNLFFLPMSVSSFKYGRSWVSKMKAIKVNPTTFKIDPDGSGNVATWVAVWNIKTVLESNDKGEWYTIGKTPTVVRTFTKDELPIIDAALAITRKANLDYGAMKQDTGTEDNPF